jgi:hypothetical protein
MKHGTRFKALTKKLSKKAYKPATLAAFIGRKKYGTKRFEQLALKGEKTHAKENIAHVGAPSKPMSQRYFKPKKDTYTPRKY